MQALQQFHERYPSKPKDHKVIHDPKHRTKRRHSHSANRQSEEGSSVTTLREVATIDTTLAQMVYQEVVKVVWSSILSIQECWFT